MAREPIPASLKRAVLVEAGHRCAIPTCRTTTTEIAHIVAWSKVKEHTFENLIALCPNCHTRYDQKGEIDTPAMRMYKQNLGVLNNRYGETERRLFSTLAKNKERVFVLGPGGDIAVANALQDGIFEDKHVDGLAFTVRGSNGFEKDFPLAFTFWVTDLGVEFLRRYAEGLTVDSGDVSM